MKKLSLWLGLVFLTSCTKYIVINPPPAEPQDTPTVIVNVENNNSPSANVVDSGNSTSNGGDSSSTISDSGNATGGSSTSQGGSVTGSGNSTNTNTQTADQVQNVDVSNDFSFNIELDADEDYFAAAKNSHKDRKDNGTRSCHGVAPGFNFVCHAYDFTGRSVLATDLSTAAHLGTSFYLDQFDVTSRDYGNGYPKFPTELSYLRTYYALRCMTKLIVKKSGSTLFSITSDDGMRIILNNNVILSDDGLHAPRTTTATVNLSPDTYNLEVQYFQGPATQIASELKWQPPGDALRYIGASDTKKAKKRCQ